MQIDLQRVLNYLLMALAIAGGVVFGALAGRMIDLSLEGNTSVLTAPLSRQISVKPLQEKDFQIILSRNLFDSTAVAESAEQIDLSSAPLRSGVAAVTSAGMSDLRLIGTVVAGADSLALIQSGKNKKTEIYTQGDELAPRVVLKEVLRKLVVIDDHGRLRELPLLEQKTGRAKRIGKKDSATTTTVDGIVPLNGGRWQISKAVAERARNNLNSLLQTARVVPEVRKGNTVGFKLVELKRGSLLEKVGLQVGDLLVEINDVELNSPEKALQIFQQVRDANNISLGLIRNGQPRTFEYRFE